MKNITVDRISQTDSSGFYSAHLSISEHIEFIEVIGTSLTECIERTAVVLSAFKALSDK